MDLSGNVFLFYCNIGIEIIYLVVFNLKGDAIFSKLGAQITELEKVRGQFPYLTYSKSGSALGSIPLVI